MPSDTGEIADGAGVHQTDGPRPGDDLAGLRPIKVVLSESGHIGEALGAARKALGLDEDDIAQVTRVRAAYISAIESFDFAALPARPFVVGYVRAYAMALGQDPAAIVARFQAEAPKVDGKLRAPGGVLHDSFSSIRWLAIVGAVVAGAVVVWNLARRVELLAAAPEKSAAHAVAPAAPVVGPAEIGAPLPTPPEATTPPVYQTPGLTAAGPAAAGPMAATRPMANGATDGAGGGVFVPAGALYGAGPTAAGVVLQARKSTTVIVRGAGGAVYFARVLAPGEAWRAPDATGLTVDVATPSSVEVFVAGTSRGRLTQAQTPLARLVSP